MNIAIIVARYGSKRIKKKNIKLFFGKPVISYSIKTAKESNLFDRIIVSTESTIIKKIAIKYGAEVPFLRPKKLAADNVGIVQPIKHVLSKLKLDKKKLNICCIFPVAPLLTKKILTRSFKKFCSSNNDFLIPVIKKKNELLYLENKKYLRMTKSLKSGDLKDSGQFYWGKKNSFLLLRKYIFKKKCLPYYIDSKRVVDVNTKKDWEELKYKYKKLIKNNTK